jgi:hypothetical protein
MPKTRVFLIIIAALLFFGLPILSGRAAVTPDSLEPAAIAAWLSHIIQYWIDLAKEFTKQLRLQ